jgi:hypothetical protein
MLNNNSEIITCTDGYKWQDPNARRKFFDDFAQDRGFDPLDVNAWYKITSNDVGVRKVSTIFNSFCFKTSVLIVQQGGHPVLRYHRLSYSRALMELYPELQFDESKFNQRICKCPFSFLAFLLTNSICKMRLGKTRKSRDSSLMN